MIHLLKEFCILLIYFYKYCISPFTPDCCIYEKTCSQYALEAFQRFGLIKGLCLTTKRLLKCNPFY